MRSTFLKIISVFALFCILFTNTFLFDINAYAANDIGNPTDGYTVWINGKNIGKEKVFYNYITVPLSDLRGTVAADPESSTPITSLSPKLPEGCRYTLSVTESTVNSIDGAYRRAKGNVMLRYITANYNENRDFIKVTAVKKEGKVKVWIAEYHEAKKKIIAYSCFDVTVKVADKGVSLETDKEKSPGVIVAHNTATVTAGSSVTVKVKSAIENASPDNIYKWTLILPKYCDEDIVAMTLSEDKRSCTLKMNSILYYDEVTYVRVRCVNEQSRSAVTYLVRIQNSITSVKGIDKAIKLKSAQNILRKVTITPEITTCFDGITDHTDKIAAYVIPGTTGGYKYAENGKLIVAKKSKTVTAAVDDAGRIKVKAGAGTPDGTQVRVLYIVKHADKTFDVYESGVITIG